MIFNITRTHGCVRNDSETHETVLLECTTGEAGVTVSAFPRAGNAPLVTAHARY